MSGFIDFLESDLSAIMSSRVFDQPMVFDPDGADPHGFRGIFSAPDEERAPGQVSNQITAGNHSITYKQSDLPRRLKRGDIVLSRGVKWRVYKQLGDGQGLLIVSVQRAEP